MDDRLRETLSAMMDDQADELAVRRVLSHDDQEAVRDQWRRWQRIRDVIHDAPSSHHGIDVGAAVRKNLDQAPVQTRTADEELRRRHAPWRWSAVAMIGLGVALGFGAGSGWDSITGAGSDTLVPIQAQVPPGQNGVVPEVALQGLDERQWEQLSRYLLEHAQNNSVAAGQGAVGYARLTSVSGQDY
ncbi:sigma-E factor negative regulatory protein RseA [Marinobacter daqiaonensis]|uniref:Sigma-E factor negative regulatory protein RseA n=1 Tax=Marinobacter daqiaonensis TaxID=650891 RepID=A0A1I6J933_9GAMM|nr:RseA family anti-sigma factor [Marinobacter daqiaonensis]SFR75010.1 sigma-E factor negative regulatory protein RseA [Marinobacter daqiaonensis]